MEDFPNKDLIDKFVKNIIRYSDEDKDKIASAAVFAAKKHGDQKRKSGEPYITHPIAVAEILMQIGMDADTVSAGLLHDTLEDTDTTEEENVQARRKETGKWNHICRCSQIVRKRLLLKRQRWGQQIRTGDFLLLRMNSSRSRI